MEPEHRRPEQCQDVIRADGVILGAIDMNGLLERPNVARPDPARPCRYGKVESRIAELSAARHDGKRSVGAEFRPAYKTSPVCINRRNQIVKHTRPDAGSARGTTSLVTPRLVSRPDNGTLSCWSRRPKTRASRRPNGRKTPFHCAQESNA